jgi:hypothetical protein
MPKATTEAQGHGFIRFALILSVVFAVLWLAWFFYQQYAGKKHPNRNVGIKANDNPSPYPLPSGERIKVRGILR